MRIFPKMTGAVCGVLAAGFLGSSASAAVVSFTGASGNQTDYVENGFVLDTARIVNGNCLSAPCLALNDNESTTITAQNGLTFSVNSFWFQLLGVGNVNTLTVTADGVALALTEAMFPHNNGGQFIDLSGNPDFQNITSLTFSTFGGGNVRIDDIDLTPIPLPAALPLMALGLGAAGFAARRRRNA